MTVKTDDFEVQIVRNCPADATYYYLFRFDRKNEQIRVPVKHALRARPPFEHPIDCKPGVWLVAYSSDPEGHNKVQHIGNRHHVEAELRVPAAVQESAEEPHQVTEELVKLLTHHPAKIHDIDADDEGLKAARIDAKKREIALDITAKEQDVMLSGAITKETMEAYMLNRFHRTELHAQVQAMFRVQTMAADMMERNFVLTEKVQEAIGRAAEMERIAAQKVASPPPPPDYTPVLNSLVAAFRDIGVSALQRDDRKALSTGDTTPQNKPTLADKAADAGVLPAATISASASAAVVPTTSTPSGVPGSLSVVPPPIETPKSPTAESPKSDDTLARLQAEYDRVNAELEALRKQKRGQELAHSAATPSLRTPSHSTRHSVPTNSPTAGSRPAMVSAQRHDSASAFPRLTSRNADCPCGSGRKYKKCCLREQVRAASTATAGSSATATPVDSDSSPVPPVTATQTLRPQDDQAAAPSSQPAIAFFGQPLILPDGVLTPELAELLAQLQAGALPDDPNAPLPRPRVAQVKQVEAVLVNPPAMDRETARRYLADGTTLEALGGLLFFNPMLRTILLRRRGA